MKSIGLLLMIFLISPFAFAQTDDPIFEQFQFNFATPGARADAMGRAFIGLADDATAAESNPAGLVILTKPEVSFEYKNINYDVSRIATFANNVAGFDTNSNSVDSPSYISFVYPAGRARFAFFRQEYLRYKEDFTRDRLVIGGGTTLNPENTSIEFLGENYGGAFAFQSTKIALGVSAKMTRLKLNSTRTINPGTSTEAVFGIDETESGFGLTVGALFNPTGKVQGGVIYEYYPKFDFNETLRGTLFAPFTINVPDRFGGGIAVRPTDTTTVLADVVFVEYSQITDDFKILFFNALNANDFEIDNATEFHAGVEQVFPAGTAAVSIRGGIYTNPEHGLNYIGQTSSISGIAADILFNKEPEIDEVGFTFGGGVAWDKFQVDAAYVISDPFDEFSLSFVVRF